jgi:succinyl-CoA synthetase beta subunit/citryl-CoA synthetase large subunit
MRLLEFEAKKILERAGLSIPAGQVIRQSEELAPERLSRLKAPLVVKAQVFASGRASKGGVLFAQGSNRALSIARSFLAKEFEGRKPEAVLIEERLQIAEEIYLAFTYDPFLRRPLMLLGRSGGTGIEGRGESVIRQTFSALTPFSPFEARNLCAEAGISRAHLPALAEIITKLARLFLEYDMTLLELNPLARLEAVGEKPVFVALDCHIELDDDALSRQQPLLNWLGLEAGGRGERPPTALERAAVEIDRSDYRGVAGRLVEFEGELGLLIGGGGASLTVFDAVRRHGGKPANYAEIGGNPSVHKVAALTRLLLSKPGIKKLAVIMNVVNNTRADLVARGVIKGVLESGAGSPAEKIAFFRIPGAWEDESKRLLAHWGVPCAGREVSLDEAARLAIANL